MNIFLLCVFVAYVQTYLEDRYSNLEEKNSPRHSSIFHIKWFLICFRLIHQSLLKKLYLIYEEKHNDNIYNCKLLLTEY